MHEIFISYRRVDTLEAGGHLYSDLCRSFGKEAVFMDTRESGIPWGAEFDISLNDALDHCHALVALIGPQWATCERSPGVRRIDAPDDWVRNEIASALRRAKLVLPVLFRDAQFPAEDRLPEDLRTLGFAKRQAYAVSEGHWDSDTERLVDALTSIPRLKQLHDFATSQTGIRKLEELSRTRADVAAAVSDSRLVLETTDREVEEVRLFKSIHDALHEIEVECLKPIRSVSLNAVRRRFDQQDRVIRRLLGQLRALTGELPVLLDIDLPQRLAGVSAALDAAATGQNADSRDVVVDALEGLVGYFLGRLNEKIDGAATRMELRKLADLIKRVGELLPEAARRDAELIPLLRAIGALDGLREELARRVQEHDLLQILDDFLREILHGQRRTETGARIPAATLIACWNHISVLRDRFKPPYSPEVEFGLGQLKALEPGIADAVLKRDEQAAIDLLTDYFNEAGALFREVDTNLKDFCDRLCKITVPLRTVLEQCRVEVRNVSITPVGGASPV